MLSNIFQSFFLVSLSSVQAALWYSLLIRKKAVKINSGLDNKKTVWAKQKTISDYGFVKSN